jgi:HEPN domain-containing protein
MRASARAGAPDAACFHAQQAAEKYLKTYLIDQDQAVPPTHNLLKLVTLCAASQLEFNQLMDPAGLLTPFAVEARYDTEFWPGTSVLQQAQDAAAAIASFVRARLQSVTVRVAAPMYASWKAARDSFNWRVDLRKFRDAAKHPGYFDRIIEPHKIEQFEDLFRETLVPEGHVERAAEVVFWKNYGNFKARDRITRDLFVWIEDVSGWKRFAESVKQLSSMPSWEAFRELIGACGHTSGFATPLTFLALYDPTRFPMVDRKVGAWWLKRFPREPQFSWNSARTVVSPTKQSWQAYLAWTEFCRRQARELSAFGDMRWRARDVEMAVWTDKDAQLPLDE